MARAYASNKHTAEEVYGKLATVMDKSFFQK